MEDNNQNNLGLKQKPLTRNIDVLDKRYFPVNLRLKIDEYKSQHYDKLSEYEETCHYVMWNKHLRSFMPPNKIFSFKINPILLRVVWLYHCESYDYYDKRSFLITVNFINYIIDLFLDYLDEREEHKDREENSDDILVKQYKLNIDEICKNRKFFSNKKLCLTTMEYLMKYKNIGLPLIRDSDVDMINSFVDRKKNRINKRKFLNELDNTEKKFKTTENIDFIFKPINNKVEINNNQLISNY